MTNEYKNNLLRWLVGKYTTGSGSNVPSYSPVKNVENTFYTDLQTQLNENYTINLYTDIKDNNGNVQYMLIYGVTDSLAPFFAVLNSAYELENVFKTYQGGTPFNFFSAINTDENGYVYGLEYDSDGHYWLTLLNNFALQGAVILRRKYTLPSNNYENIIKDTNSGSYLCYNDVDGKTAMTIKIEFGQPLTTEIYSISQTNDIRITDAIVTWNMGALDTLKMIGFEWLGNSGNNYQPVLLQTNGSTTLTRQTIGNQITIYAGGFDAKILTNQIAYYGYNNVDTSSGGWNTDYIYKVSLNDYSTEEIYSYQYPSTYYDYGEDIGGIAFLKQGTNIYYKEIINRSSTWGFNATYIGRIVGSVYYPCNMGIIRGTFFNVFNEYNYYKFTMLAEGTVNYLYYSTQVYNPNNYNGASYRDIDSMKPNSCVLYSNNDVVFARNLYNKIISNNTTTSIVEIPNLSLNEVAIDTENLLSVRNNIITSESLPITKNIYEKLYLNFINTINVINQNDIDNVVYNNIGATRLNNSASETLDYDNAKITKYKITFKDGTSVINNFVNPLTIIDNYTNYVFMVYVPEVGIKKIEFLSNDENTIYQTIDGTNLQTNKLYNINQKVEVV